MLPEDKLCIADVMRLQDYGDVRVAYCIDGGSYYQIQTVENGLKGLYRRLGMNAEVSVYLFSFISVYVYVYECACVCVCMCVRFSKKSVDALFCR